jgi:preprotein translocase subunit SecD
VLNDDPVLNGSDIKNPAESSEGESGTPNVTFGFTSHGATVFERVTKEIASTSRSCSTAS